MSYTVDANLLLYASDSSSPFHDRSSALLGQMAQGPEIVYLFWPVLMAYLRIATHPSVFAAPLTPAEATGNLERLLALPHVQTPGEHERFWSSYQRVADASVRGNLIPDAYVVALMHENGVRTIWTHDRDFRRFDGVDARDPFE
jgi:hypothetical protein